MISAARAPSCSAMFTLLNQPCLTLCFSCCFMQLVVLHAMSGSAAMTLFCVPPGDMAGLTIGGWAMSATAWTSAAMLFAVPLGYVGQLLGMALFGTASQLLLEPSTATRERPQAIEPLLGRLSDPGFKTISILSTIHQAPWVCWGRGGDIVSGQHGKDESCIYMLMCFLDILHRDT